MKEAILEPLLRKMRLNKVLPSIREFEAPRVLDIGCGWEARLLKEVAPHISRGVGIDFKAPAIKTENLFTFSYFFEAKENAPITNLDSNIAQQLAEFLGDESKEFLGDKSAHTHTQCFPPCRF